MKKANALGKACRPGISLVELMERLPNEAAAVAWFEQRRWNGNRTCGHCGSDKTVTATHKKMPYWCTACRHYFSVRTGTVLENSRLPLQKWVIALYLCVTSLKSVSSMKLHRDLSVTQKTAWFVLHRIRKAWSQQGTDLLLDPVEVDETYIGGSDRNRHEKDRKQDGQVYDSKQPVVWMKSRTTNQVTAQVISTVSPTTLQRFVTTHFNQDDRLQRSAFWVSRFAETRLQPGSCQAFRERARQRNGTHQWPRKFLGLTEIRHYRTHHHMNPKHLHRYVDEFAGRHNIREQDTADQMAFLAERMAEKYSSYQELIA